MKEPPWRVAEVMVPCTCGELVQGALEGEPFLVSCPIDRFSRVRVGLGGQAVRPHSGHPKAVAALRRTLDYLGMPDETFTLEIASPLPPSKGFGTSTADVVGAIVAGAAAAGTRLSSQDVAGLAVAVEPSDSTMFPGLGLLSHRRGCRAESLGVAPPLLAVVMQFQGIVDTVEYNAALETERLRSLEPVHRGMLGLLREGVRQADVRAIARAATASARAHQAVLFKPEFERVVRMAEELEALGVCAAHSGTALGVLIEHDGSRKAALVQARVSGTVEGLEATWISRVVGGGARVIYSTALSRSATRA